jgi:hypothetical protein
MSKVTSDNVEQGTIPSAKDALRDISLALAVIAARKKTGYQGRRKSRPQA